MSHDASPTPHGHPAGERGLPQNGVSPLGTIPLAPDGHRHSRVTHPATSSRHPSRVIEDNDLVESTFRRV